MTKKLKPKVVTNNNWPSDQEIEEVIKETSRPDYPYANYILPDNANPTEKIKYNLCQNISRYKRQNNLSEAKLTKMLGVNEEKLIDILFSKIYNLNLEELITYADNLHIPFEIKITNQSKIKHNL